MSTRRKLIAGVLMALFLLAAMLAVGYPAVEYVLFDPGAYQSAFDESGLYDALTNYSVQFVVNQIADVDESGLAAQIAAQLGSEGQQQLAALILPEGYVRTQIDLLVVQLMAYLNLEHEQLTLFIDLREVRAQLNSDTSQQVVRLLISSWPDCSIDVIAQLAVLVLTQDLANLPLCQPPVELQSPMIDIMGSMIGYAASSLPDQVDIAAGIDLAGSQTNLLGRIFVVYRWGRLVFRLSPLILVVFLILIVLVVIRPLQDLLGWSSAALLQAALMGFFDAILFWLGGQLLSTYVVQQAAQTGGEISAVFGQVIEIITTQMALWTLAPSVVLMLMGLVTAGGAALAVWSKRRKTAQLDSK
jgi:hypothetical protein